MGESLPLRPAILPNFFLLFIITELQFLGVVHFLMKAYNRRRARETKRSQVSAVLRTPRWGFPPVRAHTGATEDKGNPAKRHHDKYRR